MASRAKKKTKLQENILQDVKEISVEKKSEKNFVFDAILAVLIVGILLVLLLAPIIGASVSFKLLETEVFEKSFSSDLVDIIFAPSRGVESGLEYLFEKAEMLSSNQAFKDAINKIVETAMGDEKVNTINTIAILVYVTAILTIVTYFVSVIFAVIDRAGKKRKILGFLISFSVFFLFSLILFIAAFVAYIKTIANDNVSISVGFGVVLNFVFALIIEGLTIYKYILDKKDNIEEKNENL